MTYTSKAAATEIFSVQLRALLRRCDKSIQATADAVAKEDPLLSKEEQALRAAEKWRHAAAAVLAAPSLAGALADKAGLGLANSAFHALSSATILRIVRPEASPDEELVAVAWAVFELDVDPSTLPPAEAEAAEDALVLADTEQVAADEVSRPQAALAGAKRLLGRARSGAGRALSGFEGLRGSEGEERTGVAKSVWRFVSTAYKVRSIATERIEGPLHWQALSMLPVVGVVGGFLSEREAFEKVASRTIEAAKR